MCLLLTYESNNLYLTVKKLHICPIKEWKAIEKLMVSLCLIVLWLTMLESSDDLSILSLQIYTFYSICFGVSPIQSSGWVVYC